MDEEVRGRRQVRGETPLPHSGTYLYAITKSLGQEICRVFAEEHDIHVLDFLFYNFRYADKIERGATALIDVWGADHGGYVKRMKAAVKALSGGEVELDV